MKKPKIYIDGQAGTTGLQIKERILNRDDLELLTIAEDKRKDPGERRRLMEKADLVFLCLPDAAAIEAVSLREGLDTRIIDASTAHRTSPDWTYGFPELSPAHKAAIQSAQKVANPGCHASGFIALVYPLARSGLLNLDSQLKSFSLTGYSGGGKSMIAAYENEKEDEMNSPKPYALGLAHKHIPEMKAVCGLQQTPLFVPIVDDYEKGMLTQVFLGKDDLTKSVSLQELLDLYKNWYSDSQIQVGDPQGALFSNTLAGKDGMEIFVNGSSETGYVLSARFDNLGKGASGAAVQNMNLMLGLDEYKGLHL